MSKVILGLLLTVLLMGCPTESSGKGYDQSEPDYTVFYGSWVAKGGTDTFTINSDGTAFDMGYEYTYTKSGTVNRPALSLSYKGNEGHPSLVASYDKSTGEIKIAWTVYTRVSK